MAWIIRPSDADMPEPVELLAPAGDGALRLVAVVYRAADAERILRAVNLAARVDMLLKAGTDEELADLLGLLTEIATKREG